MRHEALSQVGSSRALEKKLSQSIWAGLSPGALGIQRLSKNLGVSCEVGMHESAHRAVGYGGTEFLEVPVIVLGTERPA